jgi:hypothetical protein
MYVDEKEKLPTISEYERLIDYTNDQIGKDVLVVVQQKRYIASYEQIKRKIITDFVQYLSTDCDTAVYKTQIERYLKRTKK